jgi:uncharacterized membrane protein SpoIIM required for sporulation/uncharacterized RDD family membrane protein YckC
MIQSPRSALGQRLEVETPEHVTLDYELAGLASRALAALTDGLILMLWLLGLSLMFSLLDVFGGSWGTALYVVSAFLTSWGYFVIYEGWRQGQTPGKRQLGIRVVQDTGHPITKSAAMLRNLLRLVDILPPPYLGGAILVALHPRGKRLGDIVAGTVVVRDQPVESPSVEAAPPATEAEAEAAGVPELSDEEFRVLHEFAERAPDLEDEVRDRLADRLASRFAERYPNRPATPSVFLLHLHDEESRRRRGRFGARAGGKARPGGGRGLVDRLVARKNDRWTAFQILAERASRDGLDSFAAAELPDYAARYREVAADLARARTYRAAPGVLARLERLVAAGHNTLYRDERRPAAQAWRFVTTVCPAAVIRARRYVLIAFLTFALPAVGGYLLLRTEPALAPEVLPDAMLERAEAGLVRQREGLGYFEARPGQRPAIATQIMTNNINVAFRCFAGGALFGVGSLVLLAFNGLAIGAASGHFANLGLLGYLWSFVIGHGVLELFAIWVAGAAGFRLGRAIIAPGERTRGEALVVEGREAVPMVGAVIVLLTVAGAIEGFVSASTAPVVVRVGISAASLVFLVLYLAWGARNAEARATRL